MKEPTEVDDKQIDVWKLYLKTTSINDTNIWTSFVTALKKNQNQIALLLLDKISLNYVSEFKQSALHIACSLGNIEVAKKALHKNFSLYATDINNNSPIDYLINDLEKIENKAILKYFIENVKILWGIKKNADYSLFKVMGTEFFPIIFDQMTDKKRIEIILSPIKNENVLIKLGSKNFIDDFTKVIAFAKEKNICLEELVIDPLHSNLLIEFAKFENPSFINLIYDSSKFNIEICNDNGESALFTALIHGNVATAQFLLDNGAKLFIKNFENKTPDELIEYFVRKNPDSHEVVKNFIESNKEKFSLKANIKEDQEKNVKEKTKKKKVL